MIESFAKFKDALLKIQDKATERSYYRHFCNFIDEYASSLGYKGVYSTSEESSKVNENSVGFPDTTIRDSKRLIGWIEVKLPIDSLSSERYQNQFKKYKDSLENIIFTNFKEWQLWQWDNDNNPKLISEITFDPIDFAIGSEKQFEDFFHKFIEGIAYEVKTPKQLALALAKKTRFLSHQVEESYDSENKSSELYILKSAFEKTLIQNISNHQFANMVAETLAYSLFLSSLEHYKKKPDHEFTLNTAIDYLPTNIPILSDLYSLVNKIANTQPNILHASQLLIDQINNSNLERIYHKLIEHKPGEDPVIQFYEPFLAEYDPKEREARGVYYTPKPVVDYIVRSVDYLLKDKFGKQDGLADPSVNILDPATGTGTFLMSAIQEIYNKITKENKPLGQEMVQKKFNEIVINHILKHFYGFELMVAPYAVAHLKLTLLLEEYGFNFSQTKNDDDVDNDRFKVYLANTLDDPNKPPQFDLPGFHSISEETKKANKIKNEAPILAIIGNPPYSNFGQMNRGIWVLELLNDYKVGLNERKINLDDDCIKFIRFAQWKINRTGQGIFAMITSNTFIDGITHRQMRKNLLDTFDEIFIYNLHGNARKNEKSPDGSKDENVFNIMQGVSINIFVKYPEKQPSCMVYYSELWGSRNNKFNALLSENFDQTKWAEVTPKNPNWFMIPDDGSNEDEYSHYCSITTIFKEFNSGIQTKRDKLTIQFDKEKLDEIISDFKEKDSELIREKYILPEDGRDWKIDLAKKDLLSNAYQYREYTYKPFDDRRTIFTGKSKGFLAYPRSPLMDNMFSTNLGLVSCRNQLFSTAGFVTKNIIDLRTYSNPGSIGTDYIFPLFIYNSRTNNLFDDGNSSHSNISTDCLGHLKKLDSVNFFDDITIAAFYYIYSILYCPTYLLKYKKQLKNDFPKIPITSSPELFKFLVKKGNELVNLHLLGENPFDKSETIFNHPENWNTKIGGDKPESLSDWRVTEIRYSIDDQRVYINPGQYFEGVEKEVWEFTIGGYQVCDKWLKDRKKASRCLASDDLKHYMKIVVAIRETIRIMKEIDELIPEWPMK